MRVITVNDDSDIIKRLVAWKCPFRAEITGSTRTIIVDRMNTKYLCTESNLPFKTLGFIKQVKSRAEKTGIEIQPWKGRDIDYFKFSNLRPGVYKDVIEIDVNGAYWEIAHRLGYTDRETYKAGKKVEKRDRLVALGSLATVKRIYEFDGENSRSLGEEKNDVTRSYFFHVARELDLIMKKVFHLYEQRVLFYWVDAFFVESKAQGFVRSELYKNRLNCKIKHIDRIEVSQTKDVKTIICYMSDGEEKPFFYRFGSKLERDAQYYSKVIEEIQEDIKRGRVVSDTLGEFL